MHYKGFPRGETEDQGAAGADREERARMEGEGQKNRKYVEAASGSTRGPRES